MCELDSETRRCTRWGMVVMRGDKADGLSESKSNSSVGSMNLRRTLQNWKKNGSAVLTA